MSVFYPAGKAILEAEIDATCALLREKTEKLKSLLKETRVECVKCKAVNKISDLSAVAHMYYEDNVYTGYYAVSEYSYTCPSCGKRVREYDDPDIKDLRAYYKHVTEEKKG